MNIKYKTSAGDVLDLICFKHYGREDAIVSVLDANPNLSEFGSVLKSGIDIILPEIEIKACEGRSLWN